ncbi:hypothetical protein FGIG_03842 [Fasciola gigantica]|uniref:KASH domain-containing protein n=1 Tax=Fasciola gigantica TaxID=46835 RepID=A0A504YXX3_FASGI|nr:hypothetical protein FGIG_03842 [Fasciola gigantica]
MPLFILLILLPSLSSPAFINRGRNKDPVCQTFSLRLPFYLFCYPSHNWIWQLDLCELQQYDRKRRKLLSLAAKVLPEVSRAESSRLSKCTTPTTSIEGTEETGSSKTRLTTAETLTTTQPIALRVPPVDQKNASTHDSMKLIDEWDTNPASVHLAVLVEHLSNEWDELLRSVQPIDPLEDKDEFLKNIRLDLDEISTWLNLLHSNLPRTSSWMAILDRLTEVQRHSALNYYQTKIKQLKIHVRTLSTADSLLLKFPVGSSDGSLQQKRKLDEVDQTIGHLKAQCHASWLHLLELIACLEHNFCTTQRPATEPCRVSSQSRKCKDAALVSERIQSSESQGFTLPTEDEPQYEQQSHSESADTFGVLSVPKDEVAPQPKDSLQDRSVCSDEERHNPTSAQEEANTNGSPKESVHSLREKSPHREIRQTRSKRQFRIHRITPDQFWIRANKVTRNCRSTPVLSSVPPIYRILMRKPTRRLLLSSVRNTKGAKIVTDKSSRTRINMGRVRPTPDAQLRWHARWLTSRANKTTEADLEEFSTQDISLHTTTASSVAANSKKAEPGIAPAPFVLVRHKAKRQQVPRGRKLRHHSSSCLSHPILWRRRPRANTHEYDCPLPVPPPRAHSFCVPHSAGLDRVMTSAQGRHSDSSSIDDASDPEYSLWQTRVKSYLDAAALADAIVRSRYGTASLKRCLSPHSSDAQRQPGSELAVTSSTSGSSPHVHKGLRSIMNISPEPKVLGLEYQEPLLHFWDDYQQTWRRRPYSAPLYSNSSDTDGCEPVSTFVEEFPWDDIAPSGLSDASQEDLLLSEIPPVRRKSRPVVPHQSITTTPGDAVNGACQMQTHEDVVDAPVYRQDTMELSTSTSVLFNQKSSSLEASFEICSQSATTGGSNNNNNNNSNNNNNAEIHHNHLSRSNESELLCGLRTHPDGGSQQFLDMGSSNEGAQVTMTTSCIPILESHFLTRVPANTPGQQSVPDVELKHDFFNPYLMDQRKCQTLPRASTKRKRRQRLAFDRSLVDPSNGTRLSSTASLDELHEWNDRGPRLDILRFSRQRLSELRTLFHRLMQINPIQISDTDADICEAMSLSHWQNSLSHVIHLAEANLQILTDHTLGSVLCSTSCTCAHKSAPVSISLEQQFNWFNCPELNSLHVQWVQFTDLARYWLLQSCSQEAIQQQLTALKVRVTELNQFMRLVVKPGFSVQTSGSERVHKSGKASASTPIGRTDEQDMRLQKQIHHCMREIEGVGEQVYRLREEFESHVIHTQRISCDPELLPTTNVVAWRGDNLVNELDQLSHELSANQQRLTSWLAMNSTDQEEDSSDVQDWEHVDYPKQSTEKWDETVAETVIRPRTPSILAEEEHTLEPISDLLITEPSRTTAIEHKHRYRVVLLAGGLMVFTCFCCYIITKLLFCPHRPCEWHGASLSALERIFGWTDARRQCPLQRERLSSLIDYTPGSMPF